MKNMNGNEELHAGFAGALSTTDLLSSPELPAVIYVIRVKSQI